MNDIELPKQFLLKKNEILLKQVGKTLRACVLTENREDEDKAESKLLYYLKTCALTTSRTPKLEGGGSNPLKSKSDFGKKIGIFHLQSRAIKKCVIGNNNVQ